MCSGKPRDDSTFATLARAPDWRAQGAEQSYQKPLSQRALHGACGSRSLWLRWEGRPLEVREQTIHPHSGSVQGSLRSHCIPVPGSKKSTVLTHWLSEPSLRVQPHRLGDDTQWETYTCQKTGLPLGQCFVISACMCAFMCVCWIYSLWKSWMSGG